MHSPCSAGTRSQPNLQLTPTPFCFSAQPSWSALATKHSAYKSDLNPSPAPRPFLRLRDRLGAHRPSLPGRAKCNPGALRGRGVKPAAPHCQPRKTNRSGESPSEQSGTSAFSHRQDKHSKLGLLRAALIHLCLSPGQTVHPECPQHGA